MAANDSSNSVGQCPLELVEILKRLGAHRRAMHEQTYGNPPWTREQSDAYSYHPLVRACEWLGQRVGISRDDLVHAAFRLTTPLGLQGMEPFPNPDGSECDSGMPDWLWMGPKFHECDLDGTTARLWEWLVEDYSAILKEAGVPTEACDNRGHPPAEISWDEFAYNNRPLNANAIMLEFGIPDSQFAAWATRGCPALGGQKLNRKKHPEAGWVYSLNDIRTIAHARNERE